MKTLLLAILLCSSAAFAQTDLKDLEKQLKDKPNDIEILMQLGIAYHDLASQGEPGALNKSANYLRRILKLEKDNPMAMAYLGSVTTIMGHDAELPMEKLSFVEDGVDFLDRAVKMAPDNLQIRIVRAMNSYYLPEFFHRLQYTLKDLTYVTKSEEFKHWPPDQQAMVYFNLGLGFEKDGKAKHSKENFEKTTQIAADSEWAKQAQKKLKKSSNLQ